MKKIILEVDVRDDDLDSLNAELNKTEANFKDLDNAAGNTSKSVDNVAKNGGAIATLDRLTGGAASQMRDLFESTKLFNLSLKGTRTALIATGIGAFVVALGVVVAYWDDIVEFITQANKKLENQIAINKRNIDLLDGELALLDVKQQILEAEGKSTTEIKKEKEKILLLIQEENQLLIDNLKIQLERKKAQVEEVTLWERVKVLSLQTLGLYKQAAEAANQSLFGNDEQKQAIDELAEALLQAEIRSQKLSLSLINLGKSQRGDRPEETSIFDTDRTVDNDFTTQLERLTQEAELKLDVERNFADQSLATTLDLERAKTEAERLNALARREIADLESQAKIQAAMNYANALSGISSLIGRETVAGKALAVASAGISTYLSAQQAYQSQLALPTPDAPIRAAVAAGAAVVAGLANIKRIISVKVPGGTGGVSSISGGSSFSSGSIPSPQFSVVGDTGINQLQNVIGDAFSKPQRSYVLFSDIEKGQDIERNSIEGATV